jgi:hypothetical protein
MAPPHFARGVSDARRLDFLYVDVRRDVDLSALSRAARANYHLPEDFPMDSTARLILLVVVIILLIGVLPVWPYSSGWGIWPSGGLGLVLVILLLFIVLQKGPPA